MPLPIEIDVWQGEIAELEVDAIVIPATESLFMTTGAAAAVKLRAGDDVEREAVSHGPIAAGSVVTTGGGRLPSPSVIHAVAVGHERRADRERLAQAIDAALESARALGVRRLAFAPLGTEYGVFAPEEAAQVALDALQRHLETPTSLEALVFAVPNPTAHAAFAHAVHALQASAR